MVQERRIPTQQGDIGTMTLLIRTEPEKNVNRWYSVCVQPTLLDSVAVVCAWGRRHTRYQRVRLLPAESPAAAKEIAANIVVQKMRRGYSVKRTD